MNTFKIRPHSFCTQLRCSHWIIERQPRKKRYLYLTSSLPIQRTNITRIKCRFILARSGSNIIAPLLPWNHYKYWFWDTIYGRIHCLCTVFEYHFLCDYILKASTVFFDDISFKVNREPHTQQAKGSLIWSWFISGGYIMWIRFWKRPESIVMNI